MNVTSISSPTAGLTGPATGGPAGTKAGATDGTEFKSILEAFQKEIFKTPEERARDAVLKKHGLSEAQYNQLPVKAREGIDREIAEAVRRATEARKAAASSNGASFSPAQLGLI